MEKIPAVPKDKCPTCGQTIPIDKECAPKHLSFTYIKKIRTESFSFDTRKEIQRMFTEFLAGPRTGARLKFLREKYLLTLADMCWKVTQGYPKWEGKKVGYQDAVLKRIQHYAETGEYVWKTSGNRTRA